MSDDPIVQIGAYRGPLSGAAILGLLSDEQLEALVAPMELERDRSRDLATTQAIAERRR